MDPDTLRAGMVDLLLRRGDLTSQSVTAAMATVPRHLFLPDRPPVEAYADAAVVTHLDDAGLPRSSASQPAIVAIMLQQLQVEPGMRVLEIGSGTGYNAALLSHLAGPDGAVTTIDLDHDIVAAASRHLADSGFDRVETIEGDAWTATPDGPFDRVIATVGVWDLAGRWVSALVDDGLLVAPLWLRTGVQASIAFRKAGERLRSVSVEPCGFMRLRGAGAGPEPYLAVGDWMAVCNDPGREWLATLSHFLSSSPIEEEAMLPGCDWFTGIALTEPGAVGLNCLETPIFRLRRGLLRPDGLALVETVAGDRGGPAPLLRWGDDYAARALRGWIERPLTLADIEVEATASDQPTDDEAMLVLHRPSFSYVVTRRR